ncbi:MAG: putative lipid II flippase FtsW, partial [Eubacteriales bacterium]
QYFLFKKQLLFAAIGIITMIIVSNIDYKVYQKYNILIMAISILLLIAVLFLGQKINGARRWFDIAGISLQPSEVAKFGVIIFTATILSKMKENIRYFFKGTLPFLLLIALVSGLIYLQPNLSTAIVIALIIIGMIFVAGANLTYLIGTGVALVGVVIYAILFTGWRSDRLSTLLNPELDPTGAGWQAKQSLLALGSGGIFGQGLGNGKQKMFYLPEPSNDFIFAHIGEELGLIGTVLILALFLLLIWRGLRIALYAPDTFASLMAFGIIFMVGIQVIINISVVTQIIPITGMPLPFISAGGSSLLFLMGGMGILLNISKHTPFNRR